MVADGFEALRCLSARLKRWLLPAVRCCSIPSDRTESWQVLAKPRRGLTRAARIVDGEPHSAGNLYRFFGNSSGLTREPSFELCAA